MVEVSGDQISSMYLFTILLRHESPDIPALGASHRNGVNWLGEFRNDRLEPKGPSSPVNGGSQSSLGYQYMNLRKDDCWLSPSLPPLRFRENSWFPGLSESRTDVETCCVLQDLQSLQVLQVLQEHSKVVH